MPDLTRNPSADDTGPTQEELDESIAGDGTRPEAVAETPTAPEADPDADEALTPEDLNESIAGDGTRPDTAGETPTAPEADPDAIEAEIIAAAAAEYARTAELEAVEAIAVAGQAAQEALIADGQARAAEQDARAFHEGTATAPDATPDKTPFVEQYRRSIALDAPTAEYLTHLYLRRRLNYQIDYYGKRVKEYDKNSFFLFRAGALIMAFSTFLAAINTAVTSAELNILIAVLPALAALISGFRQLYNWDRQAALYRDTIFDLEESRLLLPDLDQLTAQAALQIYPQLVVSAEKVFEDEVNQWGKIARGKTRDGQEIDQIKEFARQFSLDVFDESGQVDETKLGAIADVVRAASGTGQGNPLPVNQQATLNALSGTASGGAPGGEPGSGTGEPPAP